MSENDNSWLAWQKVVLAKLDDLDKHQYEIRDQMHAINDILVETVGRSGRNGRLGMLTERVEELEKRFHSATSTSRNKLVVGGAIGGGGLAALVEVLRALV